jgi:hypothetical protein
VLVADAEEAFLPGSSAWTLKMAKAPPIRDTVYAKNARMFDFDPLSNLNMVTVFSLAYGSTATGLVSTTLLRLFS